jgi:hypothetical protein
MNAFDLKAWWEGAEPYRTILEAFLAPLDMVTADRWISILTEIAKHPAKLLEPVDQNLAEVARLMADGASPQETASAFAKAAAAIERAGAERDAMAAFEPSSVQLAERAAPGIEWAGRGLGVLGIAADAGTLITPQDSGAAGWADRGAAAANGGFLTADLVGADAVIESRAGQVLERGLLIAESPGQGYDALARYGTSAKLGIALAAQANPTFVITSSFSPRQAPLTLFALGDATAPVRGIVMEVPSLIPGKEKQTLERGPLSWQFNHLLATVDFAGQYLTEWTIKSTPANALRKKAARTVALYRPGEGGTPAAELAVAGVSGECDSAGLRAVLLDLFGQGGAAPRSALLSQAP